MTYGSAPGARPAPAPGNAARPALLGSGRHLPAAGHGSVRLGVASYPEWVIGASPAAEELGPPGRGFGRGLITVRGPHFYRPLVSPVFLANRASFSGHPVLRPLQQSGWPEAWREWVRRPRCFWLRTRGMGAVGQLEACGVVRPSDLEAAVSVGGSSRSPGQLEASPR